MTEKEMESITGKSPKIWGNGFLSVMEKLKKEKAAKPFPTMDDLMHCKKKKKEKEHEKED